MSKLLTPAWNRLRPHETQNRLWRSQARFKVVTAGRRSGKTELARRRIVQYLPVAKSWSDPRYFYALPTYGQAKLVAWHALLALIPKHWLKKVPSDSAMVIETVFGSSLYVVGLDVPARIEGVPWDGCVIDESSDQKPGTFDRSVRPALADRNGWCWRVGVPKRFGPGAREFKAAYEKGERKEGGYESYTWPSWDILPEEEVKELREQLDTKDFQEQIGGNWVDAGGAAYHAFTYANIKNIPYDKTRPIIVGTDFNVDPMAWVLCHKGQHSIEVFDEIWIRNTNTQQTLDTLWQKYGTEHNGGWIFTGDATGKARKTAATTSDYRQIANDKRFKAKVRYDRSNPAVKDRLASVNRLACNAAVERNLFVDNRCVHLIDDLFNRSLDPTGNPEPAEGGESWNSGHATDALGYVIHKYFPITLDIYQGSKLVVVSA